MLRLQVFIYLERSGYIIRDLSSFIVNASTGTGAHGLNVIGVFILSSARSYLTDLKEVFRMTCSRNSAMRGGGRRRGRTDSTMSVSHRRKSEQTATDLIKSQCSGGSEISNLDKVSVCDDSLK